MGIVTYCRVEIDSCAELRFDFACTKTHIVFLQKPLALTFAFTSVFKSTFTLKKRLPLNAKLHYIVHYVVESPTQSRGKPKESNPMRFKPVSPGSCHLVRDKEFQTTGV